MKNLLLIIIMCLGLNSCQGQIKKTELLGKWQVIEFSADTPELSSELIAMGRNEAMSSEYILSSQNKSTLKSNYYSNGRNGKWEFDETSQTITFVHSNETEMGPESYNIQSLTKNKMIWIQDLNELGTITLTLEKK